MEHLKDLLCQQHQQPIFYMRVNQPDTVQAFYCQTCIQQDGHVQNEHIIRVESLLNNDNRVSKKWPPIDNKSITNQLAGIQTSIDEEQNQINMINDYFSNLLREITQKFSRLQSQAISKLKQANSENSKILQKIKESSNSSNFKHILTNLSTNVREKEKACKELIKIAHSLKEENEKQVQGILNSQIDKKVINLKYPQHKKDQIFTEIDKIDFFSQKQLIEVKPKKEKKIYLQVAQVQNPPIIIQKQPEYCNKQQIIILPKAFVV